MPCIMFPLCPIKANKSRKAGHQATRNTDNIQTNTSHNIDNPHTTITPFRYIKEDYIAGESDEILVRAGDVVLFEYYAENDHAWSHVLCTKTSKRGFVPSKILSISPVKNLQCKKIPRSNAGSIDHRANMRRSRHMEGPSSSNGDTNTPSKFYHHHQCIHELQPRFDMAHSLRGSSGEQSFQKYPDMRHLSSHGYYNIGNMDYNCKRFNTKAEGIFVVINAFKAVDENDLSVNIAELVVVLNRDDHNWWWVRRECDGVEGFIPAAYICDLEYVKGIINKGNSTVTMKSSNLNDCHTYMNHQPDQLSLPTDQL